METQINTANQNMILSPKEFDLLERIIHLEQRVIRLEQEVKDLKESMDKRFEQVDKRFNFMQWTIMFGFTLLGVMITVYRFIPPITP